MQLSAVLSILYYTELCKYTEIYDANYGSITSNDFHFKFSHKIIQFKNFYTGRGEIIQELIQEEEKSKKKAEKFI